MGETGPWSGPLTFALWQHLWLRPRMRVFFITHGCLTYNLVGYVV